MIMARLMTRWFCIITLIVAAGNVEASTLTIPNTFQSNTPAIAAEVNDNFTAVQGAVDDNSNQIDQLKIDIFESTITRSLK